MATKSNPAGQTNPAGSNAEKDIRTGTTGKMVPKQESTGVVDTAVESGGKIAGGAVAKAKEKTASVIDEQKHNLAAGLDTVAQQIRKVGQNLRTSGESSEITDLTAKYGGTIAGGVEKVSNYIEQHDVMDVVHEVQDFARRRPGVFIGGAFLLGMAATRFLKSGSGAGSSRRSSAPMRTDSMPPPEQHRTGRSEFPQTT